MDQVLLRMLALAPMWSAAVASSLIGSMKMSKQSERLVILAAIYSAVPARP